MTGDAATPDFGALGFDQALRELGEALADAARGRRARCGSGSPTTAWRPASPRWPAPATARPVPPTIEPARGDRRFKDAAWQENPVYSGMLQGYLLWSRMMRELVDVAELDRSTDRKARFAVDAMIDALAPTNTLLGNPAALRRAFETGGAQRRRTAWSGSSTTSPTTRAGRARSTCRSSRSAPTSPPRPARWCSATS